MSVFGSLLTDDGHENVFRALAAHVRGVNDCKSTTGCFAQYQRLRPKGSELSGAGSFHQVYSCPSSGVRFSELLARVRCYK
jgi:hypothetical protein